MVPGASRTSPRGPFVVLVLAVLALGLVGLLMLNTALRQGAFALDELDAQTTQLRDRQESLAEEVASRDAPDELARRARMLGMEPADDPVFLVLEPAAGGDAG
jgi:uncharacterized protein HemX